MLFLIISSPFESSAQKAPNRPAGPVRHASLRPGGETGGDGHLSLYNYHLNEYLATTYKDKGGNVKGAIDDINRVCRSRDDKIFPMDIRMIELLDRIQDHFGAETVEIISCYRSPSYNRSLRINGRDAAEESLHMRGIACDIHIDEVTEDDLFEYAKGLRMGGVGIYPPYAFVHVDLGPVRTWGEARPPKRILVGTENNPNTMWAAVTDENIYRQGQTIGVEITNNGYRAQKLSTASVWTERFRKGKWDDHSRIEIEGHGQRPAPDGAGQRLRTGESLNISWRIPDDQPFGKYRLVIFPSKGEAPVYSNEFYVKKVIPAKAGIQ